MPISKKRTAQPGDRVRVYVDESMIDEPAEVIREDRDGVIVHVWPDSDSRVAMHVRWFATQEEATAHGHLGAWPDDDPDH